MSIGLPICLDLIQFVTRQFITYNPRSSQIKMWSNFILLFRSNSTRLWTVLMFKFNENFQKIWTIKTTRSECKNVCLFHWLFNWLDRLSIQKKLNPNHYYINSIIIVYFGARTTNCCYESIELPPRQWSPHFVDWSLHSICLRSVGTFAGFAGGVDRKCNEDFAFVSHRLPSYLILIRSMTDVAEHS